MKAASSESAESIEDAKYNVTIRFTKVDDETGEPLEGLEPQENTIFLEHPDLDGFLRDALIGKKLVIQSHTWIKPKERKIPIASK